jgi:hypothetical protein
MKWFVGVWVVVMLCGTGTSAQAISIVNEQFSGTTVLSDWTADSNVSFDGIVATLQGQVNVTDVSLYRAISLSSAGAYTLSFDVYFADTTPRDLTGQPNYFQASFLSDDTSKSAVTFMGYDKNGPYDSSLNTLSGVKTDGWYHFSQNISALAGDTGTLYFDLYDRGDEFVSVAKLDNVLIDFTAAPVPEPSTLFLLFAGAGGLLCVRRWRK